MKTAIPLFPKLTTPESSQHQVFSIPAKLSRVSRLEAYFLQEKYGSFNAFPVHMMSLNTVSTINRNFMLLSRWVALFNTTNWKIINTWQISFIPLHQAATTLMTSRTVTIQLFNLLSEYFVQCLTLLLIEESSGLARILYVGITKNIPLLSNCPYLTIVVQRIKRIAKFAI